jgi:hypothetical protein
MEVLHGNISLEISGEVFCYSKEEVRMANRDRSVRLFGMVLLFTMVQIISGCGSGRSGEQSQGEESYGGTVKLEIVGTPSVNWNPTNGKSTAIIQFVVRDENALPLEASKIAVEMQVDGREIDNESLLEKDAEELAASLLYSLVLDASYSMTQHNPPAFEPMKLAAKNSLDEMNKLWSTRPGTAEFSVLWFDEFLQRNLGKWSSDDIPAPKQGTATKLYAAVDFMVSDMKQAYLSGTAAGPRDHHVMLVLSDGADNLSWFSNDAAAEAILSLQGGAQYKKLGWPATTLEDVLAKIKAHPNLTVHVIGLGSAVNDADLTKIAEAGGGVYLKNPSSTAVNSLFSRVTKEFTTLQTQGAAIPLPPGDYTFTLVIKNQRNTKSDSYAFNFHAGDSNARVIP